MAAPTASNRLPWFAARTSRVLVLIILVAVVGIGSTVFAARDANRRERAYLLTLAKTAVSAIQPTEILRLQGNRSDITNPSYQNFKTIMIRQREASPDVRFVYLFGLKDNQLYFLVDSEPINSPDYSAPGDPYLETSPEELTAYRSGVPIVEGPSRDSWGEWVSALVPIKDTSGKTVAMLGMDISTYELNMRIWLASVIPALFTLLLLALLIPYFIAVRRSERADQTRSDFVSLAAQQLRTPLTAVSWNAELLSNEAEGSLHPEQREAVAHIRDSVQRMQHVLSVLLNVARTEMGTFTTEPRSIDLVAATETILSEFAVQIAHKNITVKKRFPDGGVSITADPEVIRITLDTLISNAVKYTPLRGTITISLSKDVENVHIAVADTGAGIPINLQSKVFTRLFHTTHTVATDSEDSSNGLGLYLVKSIVESHGGRVWFASAEHQGSTFYVDLPAAGMRRIGPPTPSA
jgi:signal transduction histidine kinase